MSDFFKNYKSFYYNIDKVKPITGKLATNILSRANLVSGILKNVRSYYPYRIKEYERPDVIAEQYYGNSDLVFLIFLANNIQDPLYDWPLFGNELTNFIKEKYGSVDSARTGVHHYEQIIRSEVNNKETYDLLDETKRKIIYNYDYEIIKNNAKKQIVLIENIYTKQILQELRSLYAS